jgi:hypothetical protein
MTYLVLRINDSVRNNIPRFEQFLQTYGLYVIGRSENDQEGTVELVITANILAEVRHLTNLAFDFFGEAMVSLSIEYKGSNNKKSNTQSSKSKEKHRNSTEVPPPNDQLT